MVFLDVTGKRWKRIKLSAAGRYLQVFVGTCDFTKNSFIVDISTSNKKYIFKFGITPWNYKDNPSLSPSSQDFMTIKQILASMKY